MSSEKRLTMQARITSTEWDNLNELASAFRMIRPDIMKEGLKQLYVNTFGELKKKEII